LTQKGCERLLALFADLVEQEFAVGAWRRSFAAEFGGAVEVA
jgi:hypothetical protein